MQPQKMTVHFGYAHFAPLGKFSKELAQDAVTQLARKGMETIAFACPTNDHVEIRCTSSSEGTEFILKIQKAGEIQSVHPEPIYAIAIIIQEKGNFRLLGNIFSSVLETIEPIFEVPTVILQKEATIRRLDGPISTHAMQHLWEGVLKQKPDRMNAFGKSIRGGGVRFVTSPAPIPGHEDEVVFVEAKIESYLQDPRYLFMEAVFKWNGPTQYENVGKICDAAQVNIQYALEIFENGIEEFFKPRE